MSALLEAHALLWDEFFWPLMAVLAAGSVLPLLGVHVLARRETFLALALPESAFAGMTAALAVYPWTVARAASGGIPPGHDPSAGPSGAYLLAFAVGATALALGVLAVLQKRRGGGPAGSHAALVYVAALALSEVFRSVGSFGEERAHHLLYGELLGATRRSFVWLAATAGPAAAILVAGGRRLLFTSAEPRVALAQGLRPLLWGALLHATFALAVGGAVMTVGPLPVFGLTIVPAALARPVAGSLRQLVSMTVFLGLLGAYLGAWLSVAVSWPMGASTVIATTASGSVLWATSGLRDALVRRARVKRLRRGHPSAGSSGPRPLQ